MPTYNIINELTEVGVPIREKLPSLTILQVHMEFTLIERHVRSQEFTVAVHLTIFYVPVIHSSFGLVLSLQVVQSRHRILLVRPIRLQQLYYYFVRHDAEFLL